MIRQKLGTRWPDDRESGDAMCYSHRTRGDEKRWFCGVVSKPVVTFC
jgi:hypothetical protein